MRSIVLDPVPSLRQRAAAFAAVALGYALGVAAVAAAVTAVLDPLPLQMPAPHLREVARTPHPQVTP